MTDQVTLQKLFANYPFKYLWSPTKGDINYLQEFPDLKIVGLNYHSQKVSQNELFFCLTGYQYNGHNFAQAAYQNGAAALVVERKLTDIPLPQIVVSNSRHALSHISAVFFQHPSAYLSMIGITSTNGKTTTTYMIDRILSRNYTTGLLGTVKVKIGKSQYASDLTTPDSLDLQKHLFEMQKNSISHCTMEVSSSGLELDRVSSVDYDIAIINNINRDHIDLHGSFKNYLTAKKRLIAELTSDKFAVINVDCENTKKLIHQTAAEVITYSVEGQDASVQVKDLNLSSGNPRFTLMVNRPLMTLNGDIIKPMQFDINLKVLGLHNVYNAASAAIVGLLCGEATEVIAEQLTSFSGVERRFQLIYDGKYKIIDDHFANPGNIIVTLETLKQMKSNRLKIIYAIRGNRGVTVNRENIETLVNWSNNLDLDEIIVTSSQDVVSDRDKVSVEEKNTTLQLLKNNDFKVKYFDQLEDAVKYTVNETALSDQDVVLLAGCQGMDHGTKIVLNHLYNQLSETDKLLYGERILEPLKNRVADVDNF